MKEDHEEAWLTCDKMIRRCDAMTERQYHIINKMQKFEPDLDKKISGLKNNINHALEVVEIAEETIRGIRSAINRHEFLLGFWGM